MKRQKSNLNSLQASPVDTVIWQGREVFVKRDDLLHPYFSGNKYRKLYHYIHSESFDYTKIISYGGIQSNAMLSIAALAAYKKLPFIYYTRYLPKHLDQNLQSNYTQALALGMQVKVVEASSDEALGETIRKIVSHSEILIPQGGASPYAQEGIAVLANEIIQFKADKKLDDLVVVTPSGTGTTALWLDRLLYPSGIEVLTTPAVGDINYLLQQMSKLQTKHHVRILKTQRKYPFGKPHKDLLKHYLDFLDQGIAFDLLYSCVMWQALEEYQKSLKHRQLLYVHSGGVLGNESQLQRYRNKKIIT